MVPHPMQQFPPPQPIAPPQLFPPRCQNSARKPSSPGPGNRLACLTQLDATYAKKPSTEVPIQDLQDVGQPLQQERTLQDHQQCGMSVTPDLFVNGTANGQKVQMLVDTGAAVSVLSAEFAMENHLGSPSIDKMTQTPPIQ